MKASPGDEVRAEPSLVGAVNASLSPVEGPPAWPLTQHKQPELRGYVAIIRVMAKGHDDGRSVAERIGLFRRRAREFTEHRSTGAFTTVRTSWSAETGLLAGTELEQVELDSLLMRARVFDERNDKAIALATITRVLRNELAEHPELVAKLDELRRQQKARRRKHLRAGEAPVEPGTSTAEDLVDLGGYGNFWHLDADKQRRHDEMVDAGAGLLLHQAQLLNLQLLLAEVRETVRFVDWCEAAGIQWSTSPR